ncbi:MAG: putative O-glycosylation ligase, exosortase A system-associated [Planctomycetes bacterium]|nr:putative O-glycosylation ligase, exosortase A system-associated [Planctomycetota bacterium]
MSYRDVIVFIAVFAMLPRAFTRPFFGLLLFTWLAYMRPQDFCWGFAKPIRYSLYCALLMYSGWFLYERRKFTRLATPTRWMAGLFVCLSISLVLARRDPNDNQTAKWFDLFKVFLVTFFTVGMVDTRDRFQKIAWTIGLSLGVFGIKYGLHGILRGGRILQGPGGMMLDNNDLCLGLAMNLPFLFFLGRSAQRRWLKRLCTVAYALTCVAIVCTLSRGGFLTMCVVSLLIFNKLKKSLLPWFIAAFAALLAPLVLPEDAKERLATLQNPEEEGSAAGRLYAWGVGMKMVAANPFFGVGFEGFVSNFRRYDPIQVRLRSGVKTVRVAHNTYIQVWAELGTFALICFLGMLISTLWTLRKTRKEAQRRGPQAQWLVNYCNMLEISLLAFMFGANFLNRAHFDLMYHIVTLSTALRFIARAEFAQMEPLPEVAPPAFGARPSPLALPPPAPALPQLR